MLAGSVLLQELFLVSLEHSLRLSGITGADTHTGMVCPAKKCKARPLKVREAISPKTWGCVELRPGNSCLPAAWGRKNTHVLCFPFSKPLTPSPPLLSPVGLASCLLRKCTHSGKKFHLYAYLLPTCGLPALHHSGNQTPKPSQLLKGIDPFLAL